ncbi:unnamed protein product [Calypogeia fissa]
MEVSNVEGVTSPRGGLEVLAAVGALSSSSRLEDWCGALDSSTPMSNSLMDSSTPMDTTAPGRVDPRVVKDVKPLLKGLTTNKPHVSKAPPVDTLTSIDRSKSSPKAKSLSKPLPAAKLPKGKSSDWDIEEFCKTAEYFVTEFGLPGEGENPSKISNVTLEMLEPYFGPRDPFKDKNGYKVSSIVEGPEIRVQDVLHLAQIVDGYDKPVNGVLATTFVKGVYTKRIAKKKVNWALYVESKLRAQVYMAARDSKPKPEGPPWVRKPRLYTPPILEEFDKETVCTFRENVPPPVAAVVVDAKPTLKKPVARMEEDSADAPSTFLDSDSKAVIIVPAPATPRSTALVLLDEARAENVVQCKRLREDLSRVEKQVEDVEKAEVEHPKLMSNYTLLSSPF